MQYQRRTIGGCTGFFHSKQTLPLKSLKFVHKKKKKKKKKLKTSSQYLLHERLNNWCYVLQMEFIKMFLTFPGVFYFKCSFVIQQEVYIVIVNKFAINCNA